MGSYPSRLAPSRPAPRLHCTLPRFLAVLAIPLLLIAGLRLCLAADAVAAAPAPLPTDPSSNVGGIIITNTTWYAAASPYLLTADLVVTGGVTLTIEPGVVARGGAGRQLKVIGRLAAEGTAVHPITFTSSVDSDRSQWAGLVFDGGSGVLRHVTARLRITEAPASSSALAPPSPSPRPLSQAAAATARRSPQRPLTHPI